MKRVKRIAKTTRRPAAPAPKKARAKTRVVEAAGTMVGNALSGNRERANRVEQAMVQATLAALANGVTDAAEIKRLKIEARDKVLNES